MRIYFFLVVFRWMEWGDLSPNVTHLGYWEEVKIKRFLHVFVVMLPQIHWCYTIYSKSLHIHDCYGLLGEILCLLFYFIVGVLNFLFFFKFIIHIFMGFHFIGTNSKESNFRKRKKSFIFFLCLFYYEIFFFFLLFLLELNFVFHLLELKVENGDWGDI